MCQKLESKVASVTGAGRGLGRSCALHLAKLGANSVINDIKLDSAKEFNEQLSAPSVAEECRMLGVKAIGVEADMSRRSEVKGLIQQTLEAFGSIDILINNAGGMLTPTELSFASSVAEEDYRYILDVNLTTTILGCRAVIPAMKRQHYCHIVNMSSQAAVKVRRDGSIAQYGLAKAAISHYTRILAAEVGQYGINVNAVSPGLILTSRAIVQLHRADEPQKSQTEVNIPLRRMGIPEEVVRVTEFLVTDLSDYVTGQIISVCGETLFANIKDI